MAERVKKRSEIREQDTWKLEDMIASPEKFEELADGVEERILGYETYRGKLGSSADLLKSYLEFDESMDETISLLYAYAMQKRDQDTSVSENQALVSRVQSLAVKAMAASSFAQPEILEIPVKEGDKVTKGQTLAVLDDSDVRKTADIAKNDYDLAVSTCAEKDKEARNGYAKAIQDLNTAQANYDRTKALYDGGSVPKVDLETAENGLNDAKRERDSYTVKNGTAVADDSYRLQIEKAKYDYEKATESLEDTVLKAPIDGTVVRVNTKVGRFADKMENDAPLFVIENLDQLELEIKVSEYSIGKVALGQEAEISADILNGATVHGVVDSISPTGEEKGGGSTERVIPTTIRITDSDTKLIAGITARASIVLEESENALTVPVSAVMEKDGTAYVLSLIHI